MKQQKLTTSERTAASFLIGSNTIVHFAVSIIHLLSNTYCILVCFQYSSSSSPGPFLLYNLSVIILILSLHQLLSPQCITAQERSFKIRCYLSQLGSCSADAGGGWRGAEGTKRKRTLLFCCGGSWWHANEPWPPSLTHSVTHTHQCPHNLCHSPYCSISLPSHFQYVHI